MPAKRVPSYRLHKPTEQAVVTLSGRDLYLGQHGSDASHEAYARAVAEWEARGRMPAPPAAARSASLAAGFSRHVESVGLYVENGKATT